MTVNSGDRVIVLCERLAAATAANEVGWEHAGEDTFVWASEEGKVTVASRDADGEPPYQLDIFNPDGVKVDQLGSQLLANDQPAPWNEPLADLYRSARRKALHADELIDMLISLLPTNRRLEEVPPRGQ